MNSYKANSNPKFRVSPKSKTKYVTIHYKNKEKTFLYEKESLRKLQGVMDHLPNLKLSDAYFTLENKFIFLNSVREIEFHGVEKDEN